MTSPYPSKDNEFVAWYPVNLEAAQVQEVWRRKKSGYYVHIPFCTAICDYCGFSVERLKGANVSSYLDALRTEILRYRDLGRLAMQDFVCGHFGGGTPSAIPAEQLIAIKSLIDECFSVREDAEITVEVNPISFNLDMAQTYRRGGVNRISFGIQSFDDAILAIIGRPHRAEHVSATLGAIRDAGFDNYSIDLIYGVPGQSFDQLNRDLDEAIATGATHISSFRLEIIPMTKLKLRESARLLPERLDDEILNRMDELVRSRLIASGYNSYGAFNYAKPGYESIHNEIAFVAPQGEYIGFGNSAYSCINDHVFCNYADMEEYKNAVFSGRDPIALATRVDSLNKMARFFVLGLKFFSVSRFQFINTFGMDPETVFGDRLNSLIDRDLLTLSGDNYLLTELGRKYVNNVIKEFFVGNSVGKSQYPQFTPTLTVNEILKLAKIAERNGAIPDATAAATG